MIKINNIEYNDYDIKITWGTFSACSNNKKRTGIAPFIQLNIENNVFIGLEFTFSKEMFVSTKLNQKTNLKKYLSDITYEDEKGWISIITGKYNCSIIRTGKSEYKLELSVECEEIERLNIIINTNFELL